MSDPIDIPRLRDLARSVSGHGWWTRDTLEAEAIDVITKGYHALDADYIAALDPATVLALLAEAEDAHSLAQERAAALNEVMALRDRIASLEAERDRLRVALARFEPLCASCGGFNCIPASKPCRACGTSTVHQAGPRG